MRSILLFICLLSFATRSLSQTAPISSKPSYFGPVKGGWLVAAESISREDFNTLVRTKEKLVVTALPKIQDQDFANSHLQMLHLVAMPQLTDASLKHLDALTFLYIEDCPQISGAALRHLKSLKQLYLWNMPHITDHDLALLRSHGVALIDARNRKYKNYTKKQ